MTKANEILTAAAATLDQRGEDYDQPGGERSMGRIIAAFNALTGHEMTEAEGWQFMAVLKLVRMGTAADPTDSAVDCAAYAALAGEALANAVCGPHIGQISAPPADAMPAPDADGWISWLGGECPVSENEEVVVKLRDGLELREKSHCLHWGHRKTDAYRDIVAYRVVKEK